MSKTYGDHCYNCSCYVVQVREEAGSGLQEIQWSLDAGGLDGLSPVDNDVVSLSNPGASMGGWLLADPSVLLFSRAFRITGNNMT